MLINLILFHFVTMCIAVRYDNYSLLKGIPSKQSHLVFLRGLKDRSGFDVNFWMEGALQKPVEFTIAPGNKTLFLAQAKNISMPITVIEDNVQKLFDDENHEAGKVYLRAKNETFRWEYYYFPSDGIYGWMKDLAKTRGPELQIFSIGKTLEEKDILAAVVILKGSLRRSKVIIEGGIHAREWISPTFVAYMIEKILDAPKSENDGLKKIAMTYEWYFVPILNPDGYDYSHRTDRMWRKNRNGKGVDLNRNFGFMFGEHTALRPDEETFPGMNAFSEKESKAMSNYVKFIGNGSEYYLSFHSFGQYMIIPYGHTNEHLDNYDEVKNIANKASSAIYSIYNTVYKVGTAYETVGYKLGGASICWVKRTFDVPYVLTFELRDKGRFGFVLPGHLILPTCVETLTGLISLLNPNKTPFSDVKKKYEKQADKYHHEHDTSHSGSSCMVLFKNVIVFSVFCNKLL